MSQSKRSRLTPSERRATFVQVAIGLFFRHGVENTTMQQIAKEAKVSYGLFYHYFRSKDDILSEALNQFSFIETIEELLSHHEQPLEEHLCKLSEVYMKLMEEHREIVWLFLSESRKRPALAQRLQLFGNDMRASLTTYLAARQVAGEVRPDLDLDVTTRLIYSQLFMRHLWAEPDLPGLELSIQVLLRGLLP